MKRIVLTLIVTVFLAPMVSAQGVFGKWKTIDDVSGEAKSIIEIYEEDGKVYGKVLEIFNPDKQDVLCQNCEGKDKDRPVKGLVIIKGLEKDGDEYNSGKILDPENGKLYKCYIVLEEADKLKVRGYIGISLLGRTQYWERHN